MKRMTFSDLHLDGLMERGARLSQPAILLFSAALLAVAAIADWLVGHISLGVLYILPMMLAALVLEPLELAALALFSAFLRSRFDYPGSDIEIVLRFAFASVSYFVRFICGGPGIEPQVGEEETSGQDSARTGLTKRGGGSTTAIGGEQPGGDSHTR